MENKDVNRIQKRLHILYLCILCFIFLLVGRLFQLQIF